MKDTKRSRQHNAVIAFFVAALFVTGICAEAQQEMVLYSFPGNAVTANGPVAGLIFDGAGNLYGTTMGNGNRVGTVFELSPVTGGGWSETTIYTFGANGSGDGNFPMGSLVFDAAGNLYGTTL